MTLALLGFVAIAIGFASCGCGLQRFGVVRFGLCELCYVVGRLV